MRRSHDFCKKTNCAPPIHPARSTGYTIARATFLCYFIKDQSVISHCQTETDVKIFCQYLAPASGIIHRVAGTEPFAPLPPGTAVISLETPKQPFPAAERVVTERLCFRETDIRLSGAQTAARKISGYHPPGTCSRFALSAEHARAKFRALVTGAK